MGAKITKIDENNEYQINWRDDEPVRGQLQKGQRQLDYPDPTK